MDEWSGTQKALAALLITAIVIGGFIGMLFLSRSTGEESLVNTMYTTTETGLKYQVIQEGSGEPTKAGDVVSVLYTGKLEDGTVFDTTANRNNQPIQFQLGSGNIIQGWDEGVTGMKKGERKVLVIPPNLAYGPMGKQPVIPPNATLTFEVEIVGINE